MKKCVIFDMDGVIIDSEPIHMACERKIFKLMNLPVTVDEHNSLIGSTDEKMWSVFNEKYGLPINISDAIQLKKSLYFEYLKQYIHLGPVPYVDRLIANLNAKDFLLVLASSSPHVQINYVLKSFKLMDYFKNTISGEDVKNGKPDPDIFIKAAESVDIDSSACVVIEDSNNGVTAAKNAGMRCVGYINPNSGKQNLKNSDMTIKSLSELSTSDIDALLV